MNTILYPEDIIAVIDSFLACNEGDEATERLLINVEKGDRLSLLKMRPRPED